MDRANLSGSDSMISIAISCLALTVSVISLIVGRRSWLETYRPIITARVSTKSGGNVAILYNLIIENTGNRPATDIRLNVDQKVLHAALKPLCSVPTTQIRNCFDPHYTIPILANDRSTSTAFGKTSNDSECMWIADSHLPVTITYSDLEGRKYCSKVTLCVRDDGGFAGFYYADK
jgi:hypothetical protein